MWHLKDCWCKQLSLPFADFSEFELKASKFYTNLRVLSFLDRSVIMIAVLRVWGTASLILVLSLWLCSQPAPSPVEARMAPFLDPARSTLSLERPDLHDPYHSGFHEAPAFRNGKQCVTSRNGNDSNFVCDASAVHIAMTLDATYLRGSMAAIFSILKHSACPENVIFHFLVSDRDSELEPLVQLTFPSLRFKVYHFSEDLVKTRISSSIRSALEQPLNYARNYLAYLLEDCIHRVIYLDSDLVVVDDIAQLWSTRLGQNVVGAPEYCQANFTKYFTPAFWGNDDLATTFKGRKPCYFNTGVMVMDLAKWRAEDYTRRIESWMDIQKEKRIYELGSLPPFLLVFAGSLQPIEHRWNQHGLGGDNVDGRCRDLHPGPVSLLHWSGKGKPWMRLDDRTPCPIDSLWAPYDLFM